MIDQGFVSDVPMETLTVRGLFEIIPRYREIKGIQNRLRDRLLAERPAAFIGADYPGFNLGLEEQLAQPGSRPCTSSARRSGPGAAGASRKSSRAVSHMLVIFPFEEQIYREAGVPVTYIGHPLAETIPLAAGCGGGARGRWACAGRARGHDHAGQPDGRAEIPGRALRAARPAAGGNAIPACASWCRWPAKSSAPTSARSSRRPGWRTCRPGWPRATRTRHRRADAVLVASGTATLEVALFKKPMVIAYKVMRASWEIMRHMGYQPWIGLPNILAREFLVPELLQHAATPKRWPMRCGGS